MLPVARSSLDKGMIRRPTDLINKPLDGLLPPDSDSLLKGMQLSLAVTTWVSNLELDE
jgi:hypothetical protein